MAILSNMMNRVLGNFLTPDTSKEDMKTFSFGVVPEKDGAEIVSDDMPTSFGNGGWNGQGQAPVTNVKDTIAKYRDVAMEPEVMFAIEEITNEAIVYDEKNRVVDIDLEDAKEISQGTKKKIATEFDEVLRLLDFRNTGSQKFRDWYIDGRAFYNPIIDKKNPKDGIKEVRWMDPLNTKKCKKVTMAKDPATGVEQVVKIEEYFEHKLGDSQSRVGSQAVVRLSKDAVVYVPSGLVDKTTNTVLSYLTTAIRPTNLVRSTEDNVNIYRAVRAPERRIFYVDVGSLPKTKAEQYMNSLMNKYRTQVSYDSKSGQILNNKRFMSVLEDFWLPRRGDGAGTKIDTLPGGEGLGMLDDLDRFQQLLYRSLHIPVTRFSNEPQSIMNSGRATDINRDEIRFSRFVQKLRQRFNWLFTELLRIQCILKEICTQEEWDSIVNDIRYDYIQDNMYEEQREADQLKERVETAMAFGIDLTQCYSVEWVRKNILKQTDQDIKEQDKLIAKEQAAAAQQNTDPVNNDDDNGIGDFTQGDPDQQDPNAQPDGGVDTGTGVLK
jgi:hypothetical protein